MGESVDCHGKITSQELAPIHSVKNGTFQNACLFYKTKSGCRCGEKCSYAHRQVDEQPSKKAKNDGDKNAVTMLKKCAPCDKTEKRAVFRDMNHERHGPIVCNSSNA